MESRNVVTLRNAHQAFSAKKLDQARQFVATQVRFTDHGRGQVLERPGRVPGLDGEPLCHVIGHAHR